MLRNPKKIVFFPAKPTHVEVFVENYDLLKEWAVRFTERDHERAEDLLHDAFIQFTLNHPDLDSIKNLESYLYVLMRNLHLSQVRRAARAPFRSLSAVEYDTVEVSSWASDPRDRIRMRDELGTVCQYACMRKESSKAGSVLILRFFHGYYPQEIALIMKSERRAVTERLQLARAEGRVYLEDPSRLAFLGNNPVTPTKLTATYLGDDLRLELRKQIFSSRLGDCLDPQALEELYRSENIEGLDRRTLAHIVSCGKCLDAVNSLLGIPGLGSRYPLDTAGKDPGPDDTDGGGNGGGGDMLDTFIRRRDATYHHRPQELCVSVNGQVQSFQKVAAATYELTLIIDMIEKIGFVEIFSEQGIRLLMFNVKPPPKGEARQFTSIELSDGRKVDANLNFGGAFPTLQVTYNDPDFTPDAIEEPVTDAPNIADTGQKPDPVPFAQDSPSLISQIASWKYWLQPARVTAAFAVLVIAALVWLKFVPTATVSAAELLNRSAEADQARLANNDRVLHRMLDLEEYDAAGKITSRKKIEVWQSSERGITARRLYDEAGRLAMGDWRQTEGIQTLYTRGESAKLRPLPAAGAKPIDIDEAWQLTVSAREFTELLGDMAEAEVETRSNDYLITYAPPAGNPAGITKASIVLSRDDLHAIEQMFTLRSGDETRSVRFVETSYSWKPSNSVAPAVFEPNVELTGAPGQKATPAAETNANTNTNTSSNANTAEPPPANTALSANIATASLEVEVIEALNNAGAFMGEQVDVTRTPDGRILVTALLETDQRKRDLLAALANVRKDPAVQLRIETVAEAQARQRRSQASSAKPQTVEQVEAAEDANPVLAELKNRFSDDEARRFAANILNRSRQAGLHALAMRQLSNRFSEADLQSLTPAERNRWLALIRGHAESFLSDAQSLQRELARVFPEAVSASGTAAEINSDKELQARVRELFDMSGAIERDLGQSFALTAGRSAAAPVKTAAFRRRFADAVAAARSIAAAR